MEINFIEISKDIRHFNSAPKPASLYIPKWFKDAPLYIDPSHKSKCCPWTNTPAPNTTYKNCSPLLDSFTTGYIFELPSDIQFTLKEAGNIEWNSRIKGKEGSIDDFVSLHSPDQYPNLPKLHKTCNIPLVFKWSSGYSIKTPTGYSTLYTQPFNRNDLPFTIMSGVVDTDTYNLEVMFPFQITYDFKGPGDFIVVEKGTPLCQILPFKRDDWKSKIIPYDSDNIRKKTLIYFSKIVNAYKSRYWNKKRYL